MYHYLHKLYELTSSDDLAGFSGGMASLPDGKPADPAVQADWEDAIFKAKNESAETAS